MVSEETRPCREKARPPLRASSPRLASRPPEGRVASAQLGPERLLKRGEIHPVDAAKGPIGIPKPEHRVEEALEAALAAGANPAPARTQAAAVDPRAALAERDQRVESLVGEWAAAWARQDVDAYLAHYSAAFKPEKGLTRKDWAAQRRTYLLTGGGITWQSHN